jgi:hypothetical protein
MIHLSIVNSSYKKLLYKNMYGFKCQFLGFLNL